MPVSDDLKVGRTKREAIRFVEFDNLSTSELFSTINKVAGRFNSVKHEVRLYFTNGVLVNYHIQFKFESQTQSDIYLEKGNVMVLKFDGLLYVYSKSKFEEEFEEAI